MSPAPTTLALLAIVGHLPAMWLLAPRRIPTGILMPNLLAITGTLGACTGAWFAGQPPVVVAGIFALGHLGWGIYLARAVLRTTG